MGTVVVKKALTSPWVPHHINSSSDGSAIDIPDLAAAGVTLPVTNWFIFAWIYIISMQLDTGALLSVTIGTSPPLEFKWSSTDYTFVQGSQSSGSPEARISNEWFLVVLGCDKDGNTGGRTIRKGHSSIAKTWAASTPLQSPASLKAPVGVGNFEVMLI
jgi:hypothetical protein